MPILMMVPKFNDIPDGKHVIAFHLLESDLNKIRFVANYRQECANSSIFKGNFGVLLLMGWVP